MTETEAMNQALREANRDLLARAEKAELGWKRAAADLLSETTRANAAESALAEERGNVLRIVGAYEAHSDPEVRLVARDIAHQIRTLASGNAPESQPRTPFEIALRYSRDCEWNNAGTERPPAGPSNKEEP